MLRQVSLPAADLDSSRPVARPGLLDWLFRALSAVLALHAGLLLLALVSGPMQDPQRLLPVAVGLLMCLCAISVSGLIVWRVPGHATGRFLLLMASGQLCFVTALFYHFELPLGPAAPLVTVLGVIFLAGIALPSFFYAMMTFPTGSFYPEWIRSWVIAFAVVKLIGVVVDVASGGNDLLGAVHLPSNPLAIPALVPLRPVVVPAAGAISAMVPLGLIAGSLSLARRYRASTAAERRRIRGPVIAFALVAVTIIARLAAIGAGLGPANVFSFDLTALVPILALWVLMLSLGIGILRYRLFDARVIVNRTLVYVLLTLAIGGIYVLVVGALGLVFQMSGSLFVSLLATGLVAALFHPLRTRLQRAVNRLMYGERDDPLGVLTRLGQRLEGTLAPEAVLPAIVETVGQALRLAYVAVALQSGDACPVVAAYGLPVVAPGAADKPLTLPLTYAGETVGFLLAAPRHADEPFTPAERRLLEDIARQAGVASQAVRLTIDLQRSRERLVTAREEERRRLRRDLHDGLGPQLASLTLQLDAARNLLKIDPQGADTLLAQLKGQTQAAIADIRRLVYELRPPALDELGLVSAVREQAARYSGADGLSVTVVAADPLPALPAAVEVAAYRIVQEALANIVQHAHARACTVRLAAGRDLMLDVEDDGWGLPAGYRAGVGLASMRERAGELGGTCTVAPRPGGGTAVCACLPLGAEAEG